MFYSCKPGSRRLIKTALPTIFSHGGTRHLAHQTLGKLQLEHNYFKVTQDTPVVQTDDISNKNQEDMDVAEPDLGNLHQSSSLPQCGEALEMCDLDVAINQDVETSCFGCMVKNKNIQHLETIISKLKHQLTVQKRERSKEKKKTIEINAGASFFNQDQLKFLTKKSLRGNTWSTATVRDALKIRFAAGTSGYECLLGLGYPLPAIRTLQRRTESILFNPGLLPEVFDLLALKARQMSRRELLCSLVLDEMSITPDFQWDCKSDSLIGGVTLGNCNPDTKASKCLVYMLAGIGIRWKQIVAYDFTAPTLRGQDIAPRMVTIMEKAFEIGIKVISVTTDMGGSNQSMWS